MGEAKGYCGSAGGVRVDTHEVESSALVAI